MVQPSPPPVRPVARTARRKTECGPGQRRRDHIPGADSRGPTSGTDRMPYPPPADIPRCAVVDLGSNSVRLVVYEGHTRNPVSIFNEKAVLRLGRGLYATGRLNE